MRIEVGNSTATVGRKNPTFSSLMQPCIAENEDIDDYFNQDYDDQQQQQQQQQEEEEEGREEDYFTSSPTPAPTTTCS